MAEAYLINVSGAAMCNVQSELYFVVSCSAQP